MTSLKTPRVVIDTNIFISGFLFGGNPGTILKLFRSQKILLIISPEIEHELLIKLETFGLSGMLLGELKDLIDERAMRVVPRATARISRDLLDDMFLSAAAEAHADAIITGDKDLLSLHSYRGIPIVTPRQFLENLRLNATRKNRKLIPPT